MATSSPDTRAEILALRKSDIAWSIGLGSVMGFMLLDIIADLLKKRKINPFWALPLCLVGGGLFGGLMARGIYWRGGY